MILYYPEFINEKEEEFLITFFNQKEWDTTLSRRTQHYGWKYPYKTKDKLEKTEEIPKEIDFILQRVNDHYKLKFDQLIVNEYLPGQGISPHIDHPDLFGDTILSLSLGSNCVMNFDSEDHHFYQNLERRSLLGIQGKHRYKYLHSIPARKKDNGIERQTRISLTFRIIKI